jgi:uncharacterized membrane protein
MLPADTWLFALTFLSALGCALVAGIFLAFSSFVMGALARISPPSGIAAMQAINVVVLNPLFLGLFMGTALACAVLFVYAVMHWQIPAALYLAAGSLCYVLGTFGVTMAFNVPRNNALAQIEPSSAEGCRLLARLRFELDDVEPCAHVRGLGGRRAAGLGADPV